MIEDMDTLTLIQSQDRVVLRLRAALLALGKTAVEVDRIARDADEGEHDDFAKWKQDAETQIQATFDAAASDLRYTVESFRTETKAFAARIDGRFLTHLNLIGDVTRAYNRLEGRTIRGRARRLWTWMRSRYHRVRYFRWLYHDDDDDDGE